MTGFSQFVIESILILAGKSPIKSFHRQIFKREVRELSRFNNINQKVHSFRDGALHVPSELLREFLYLSSEMGQLQIALACLRRVEAYQDLK